MTGAWFLSYVEQVLVPTLRRDDVMILDNLLAPRSLAVREAIKAGKDISEANRTVAQTERARWALFDDYNARNVTEAFRELEWE